MQDYFNKCYAQLGDVPKDITTSGADDAMGRSLSLEDDLNMIRNVGMNRLRGSTQGFLLLQKSMSFRNLTVRYRKPVK